MQGAKESVWELRRLDQKVGMACGAEKSLERRNIMFKLNPSLSGHSALVDRYRVNFGAEWIDHQSAPHSTLPAIVQV